MMFNQKEAASVKNGIVVNHELTVECVCCKMFVTPLNIIMVDAANPSSDMETKIPFCVHCHDL